MNKNFIELLNKKARNKKTFLSILGLVYTIASKEAISTLALDDWINYSGNPFNVTHIEEDQVPFRFLDRNKMKDLDTSLYAMEDLPPNVDFSDSYASAFKLLLEFLKIYYAGTGQTGVSKEKLRFYLAGDFQNTLSRFLRAGVNKDFDEAGKFTKPFKELGIFKWLSNFSKTDEKEEVPRLTEAMINSFKEELNSYCEDNSVAKGVDVLPYFRAVANPITPLLRKENGVSIKEINGICKKFTAILQKFNQAAGPTGLKQSISYKIVSDYLRKIYTEVKIDQGKTDYLNILCSYGNVLKLVKKCDDFCKYVDSIATKFDKNLYLEELEGRYISLRFIMNCLMSIMNTLVTPIRFIRAEAAPAELKWFLNKFKNKRAVGDDNRTFLDIALAYYASLTGLASDDKFYKVDENVLKGGADLKQMINSMKENFAEGSANTAFEKLRNTTKGTDVSANEFDINGQHSFLGSQFKYFDMFDSSSFGYKEELKNHESGFDGQIRDYKRNAVAKTEVERMFRGFMRSLMSDYDKFDNISDKYDQNLNAIQKFSSAGKGDFNKDVIDSLRRQEVKDFIIDLVKTTSDFKMIKCSTDMAGVQKIELSTDDVYSKWAKKVASVIGGVTDPTVFDFANLTKKFEVGGDWNAFKSAVKPDFGAGEKNWNDENVEFNGNTRPDYKYLQAPVPDLAQTIISALDKFANGTPLLAFEKLKDVNTALHKNETDAHGKNSYLKSPMKYFDAIEDAGNNLFYDDGAVVKSPFNGKNYTLSKDSHATADVLVMFNNFMHSLCKTVNGFDKASLKKRFEEQLAELKRIGADNSTKIFPSAVGLNDILAALAASEDFIINLVSKMSSFDMDPTKGDAYTKWMEAVKSVFDGYLVELNRRTTEEEKKKYVNSVIYKDLAFFKLIKDFKDSGLVFDDIISLTDLENLSANPTYGAWYAKKDSVVKDTRFIQKKELKKDETIQATLESLAKNSATLAFNDLAVDGEALPKNEDFKLPEGAVDAEQAFRDKVKTSFANHAANLAIGELLNRPGERLAFRDKDGVYVKYASPFVSSVGGGTYGLYKSDVDGERESGFDGKTKVKVKKGEVPSEQRMVDNAVESLTKSLVTSYSRGFYNSGDAAFDIITNALQRWATEKDKYAQKEVGTAFVDAGFVNEIKRSKEFFMQFMGSLRVIQEGVADDCSNLGRYDEVYKPWAEKVREIIEQIGKSHGEGGLRDAFAFALYKPNEEIENLIEVNFGKNDAIRGEGDAEIELLDASNKPLAIGDKVVKKTIEKRLREFVDAIKLLRKIMKEAANDYIAAKGEAGAGAGEAGEAAVAKKSSFKRSAFSYLKYLYDLKQSNKEVKYATNLPNRTPNGFIDENLKDEDGNYKAVGDEAETSTEAMFGGLVYSLCNDVRKFGTVNPDENSINERFEEYIKVLTKMAESGKYPGVKEGFIQSLEKARPFIIELIKTVDKFKMENNGGYLEWGKAVKQAISGLDEDAAKEAFEFLSYVDDSSAEQTFRDEVKTSFANHAANLAIGELLESPGKRLAFEDKDGVHRKYANPFASSRAGGLYTLYKSDVAEERESGFDGKTKVKVEKGNVPSKQIMVDTAVEALTKSLVTSYSRGFYNSGDGAFDKITDALKRWATEKDKYAQKEVGTAFVDAGFVNEIKRSKGFFMQFMKSLCVIQEKVADDGSNSGRYDEVYKPWAEKVGEIIDKIGKDQGAAGLRDAFAFALYKPNEKIENLIKVNFGKNGTIRGEGNEKIGEREATKTIENRLLEFVDAIDLLRKVMKEAAVKYIAAKGEAGAGAGGDLIEFKYEHIAGDGDTRFEDGGDPLKTWSAERDDLKDNNPPAPAAPAAPPAPDAPPDGKDVKVEMDENILNNFKDSFGNQIMKRKVLGSFDQIEGMPAYGHPSYKESGYMYLKKLNDVLSNPNPKYGGAAATRRISEVGEVGVAYEIRNNEAIGKDKTFHKLVFKVMQALMSTVDGSAKLIDGTIAFDKELCKKNFDERIKELNALGKVGGQKVDENFLKMIVAAKDCFVNLAEAGQIYSATDKEVDWEYILKDFFLDKLARPNLAFLIKAKEDGFNWDNVLKINMALDSEFNPGGGNKAISAWAAEEEEVKDERTVMNAGSKINDLKIKKGDRLNAFVDAIKGFVDIFGDCISDVRKQNLLRNFAQNSTNAYGGELMEEGGTSLNPDGDFWEYFSRIPAKKTLRYTGNLNNRERAFVGDKMNFKKGDEAKRDVDDMFGYISFICDDGSKEIPSVESIKSKYDNLVSFLEQAKNKVGAKDGDLFKLSDEFLLALKNEKTKDFICKLSNTLNNPGAVDGEYGADYDGYKDWAKKVRQVLLEAKIEEIPLISLKGKMDDLLKINFDRKDEKLDKEWKDIKIRVWKSFTKKKRSSNYRNEDVTIQKIKNLESYSFGSEVSWGAVLRGFCKIIDLIRKFSALPFSVGTDGAGAGAESPNKLSDEELKRYKGDGLVAFANAVKLMTKLMKAKGDRVDDPNHIKSEDLTISNGESLKKFVSGIKTLSDLVEIKEKDNLNKLPSIKLTNEDVLKDFVDSISILRQLIAPSAAGGGFTGKVDDNIGFYKAIKQYAESVAFAGDKNNINERATWLKDFFDDAKTDSFANVIKLEKPDVVVKGSAENIDFVENDFNPHNGELAYFGIMQDMDFPTLNLNSKLGDLVYKGSAADKKAVFKTPANVETSAPELNLNNSTEYSFAKLIGAFAEKMPCSFSDCTGDKDVLLQAMGAPDSGVESLQSLSDLWDEVKGLKIKLNKKCVYDKGHSVWVWKPVGSGKGSESLVEKYYSGSKSSKKHIGTSKKLEAVKVAGIYQDDVIVLGSDLSLDALRKKINGERKKEQKNFNKINEFTNGSLEKFLRRAKEQAEAGVRNFSRRKELENAEEQRWLNLRNYLAQQYNNLVNKSNVLTRRINSLKGNNLRFYSNLDADLALRDKFLQNESDSKFGNDPNVVSINELDNTRNIEKLLDDTEIEELLDKDEIDLDKVVIVDQSAGTNMAANSKEALQDVNEIKVNDTVDQEDIKPKKRNNRSSVKRS